VSRGSTSLESSARHALRATQHRAVFDSSWRRQSANEAAVLAKPVGFRGGFTRRAAEQVRSTLRTLAGLVNKRCLDDAEGRCSLHELLRQYEHAEQLAAAARTRQHSSAQRLLLGTLAARESDLTGHNQIVTLNDIEATSTISRVP